MGKHRKPKDGNGKRVATLGAAAVALPTLALTFSPEATASTPSETTLNIPRIVGSPAEGTTPSTPEKCADVIVQRGDNFSGIAARYGVPLDALKPLNPGVAAHKADYSLIYVGGHIHLPDGSCDPKSPPPIAPTWHHHQRWHHHHDHDGDGGGTPVPTPTPPPAPGPTPTPTPTPAPGSTVPVIAPDAPGTPSGYAAHSVSFWGPLISQAMGLVGGRVAANHDVSGVESLMLAESSGNPNAINLTDSNAQAGHPSKGLMQTIQATFDGFHQAGTSTNIYDPLANICAALNYINALYGGNIPSSPY